MVVFRMAVWRPMGANDEVTARFGASKSSRLTVPADAVNQYPAACLDEPRTVSRLKVCVLWDRMNPACTTDPAWNSMSTSS